MSSNDKLTRLKCHTNQLAALNLSGLTLDEDILTNMADERKTIGQSINNLKINQQQCEAYPNRLNFTDYMTSGETGNIDASSVQGFDEDNAEITTVYADGVASFAASPAKVRYRYNTDPVVMRTAIIDANADILSLNNHVYRLINHPSGWQNAKSYCEALNGHLATITDDAEQSLILEMLQQARLIGNYPYPHCWLGVEKISGDWRWITGEDFDVERIKKSDGDVDIEDDGEDDGDQGNDYLAAVADILFAANGRKYDSGFICEWEPFAANFEQYSDEYKRWLESPDVNPFGEIPDEVGYSHLEDDPPEVEYDMASPAKYDPRELDLEFRVGKQGD